MGEDQQATPDEQLRQLFGQVEKRTAAAMEEVVHRDAFGEILARVTENVMGLTRIGFDVLDLTVRNLRPPGRLHLIPVGPPVAPNEDQLGPRPQEVQAVQDRVGRLKESSRKSSS